jgi:hypothetical protein
MHPLTTLFDFAVCFALAVFGFAVGFALAWWAS